MYRFRLRPLTRSNGAIAFGEAEYRIDIGFSELRDGSTVQTGRLVTSDGRESRFVVGEAHDGEVVRVFAGLASDPFFMDVEAAIRTDISGRLSFERPGVNTVQFRDVLAIVVEVPFAPVMQLFDGATLVGAVAETIIRRRGKLIRIERLGRPEIKNLALQGAARDTRATGVELRDLYNREDAFALSRDYRQLYQSRLDANLAFFDGLDGHTAWPLGSDGRHPLRDLLMDDYLIVDLAHPFAPGRFLEIERAALDGRPHESAGGRWLDDDIVDEMLTLYVNGGRDERFDDGVDAPTKPASRSFPYVREPNNRTDLPIPAFAQ